MWVCSEGISRAQTESLKAMLTFIRSWAFIGSQKTQHVCLISDLAAWDSMLGETRPCRECMSTHASSHPVLKTPLLPAVMVSVPSLAPTQSHPDSVTEMVLHHPDPLYKSCSGIHSPSFSVGFWGLPFHPSLGVALWEVLPPGLCPLLVAR